ncbi:hypothetical protein GH714_015335 [Hevea brasiliensis]|uniref:Uncharacterized protein n=1 Tax=Hevea brasiliensis TaxID=3981 RepID=A0A6A6LI94_HEVBR|nr:hypothetical protein GH714_015335 [Hevea brasiliensis]
MRNLVRYPGRYTFWVKAELKRISARVAHQIPYLSPVHRAQTHHDSACAGPLSPKGYHIQVPESPGTRLKREGLTAQHPVVLVPGFITGGLELWEGNPCAEGLFRKRLWGGSFSEMLKSLDPPGVRVRAVQGLAAADYLLEIRDQALSKLKSVIELMYVTNGYKKVIAVPHSMGSMYFLHFLKWIETPPPMGGGVVQQCDEKSNEYGRIVSFSKSASQLPSSELPSPDTKIICVEVIPSDRCKSIPFRIDTSVDGEEGSCLKSGVYLVDGEESVPALSAAFMCAKGWKGSARFNPSSSPTYIREYQHKPSTSLLEGRSTESGSHVEILGNDAFIEDLLRVAAGATDAEIRGYEYMGKVEAYLEVTVLGILVSKDGDGCLLLDDGTGVIQLSLSGDFRLRRWDIGMYVMVIGGYFVGTGESPMIKVHKIVDLSPFPDREAMWYLEVMEAYKLFYQPLIKEFMHLEVLCFFSSQSHESTKLMIENGA